MVLLSRHGFLTVFVAVFAALFMLVSCASAPRGEPVPEMTFAHLQPLSVSVRTIDVQNTDSGDSAGFAVAPEVAAARYMKARFKPLGVANSLNMVIEEAGVKKSVVKSQEDAARFFGVGGAERYDITLRLRLEHVNDDGLVMYGKVLTAHRVVNISEHASIAQREKHQFEAMETLFREIDQNVQQIVLRDMGLGL